MGVVKMHRSVVWLEGVAVRRYNNYRYPHNNYYFSKLHLYYIALFWQQHPYFLFMLFLCNIANVAQKTFEIVQKSRSLE